MTRQVRCDQCGRDFVADEQRSGTCPSCGWAIEPLPVQAAAVLPERDDPITRPVRLAEGVEGVAAMLAAAPSPLADRPTSPPPPPLDPMTAPAAPYEPYEPPSLPRSRASGAEVAQLAVEDDSQTRVAHTSGGESAVPVVAAEAQPLDPTLTMPPGIIPPTDSPAAGSARPRGPRRAPEQPPRRRTPRWLTVLSAAALFIVLMVSSGVAVLLSMGRLQGLLGLGAATNATPTAQSTASAGPPTPAAGFRTYTAPDGSYRIDVPINWPDPQHHRDVTTELSLFYDPGTQSNFEIEQITSSGASDPKGTDDLFFAALANTVAHPTSGPTGTATVTNKSLPDDVAVAGSTWTRETADIVVRVGGQTQTLHVVALATVHGPLTYLVAYFAPQSTFDSVDATDFQRMVGSLILLSAKP